MIPYIPLCPALPGIASTYNSLAVVFPASISLSRIDRPLSPYALCSIKPGYHRTFLERRRRCATQGGGATKRNESLSKDASLCARLSIRRQATDGFSDFSCRALIARSSRFTRSLFCAKKLNQSPVIATASTKQFALPQTAAALTGRPIERSEASAQLPLESRESKKKALVSLFRAITCVSNPKSKRLSSNASSSVSNRRHSRFAFGSHPHCSHGRNRWRGWKRLQLPIPRSTFEDARGEPASTAGSAARRWRDYSQLSS